MQCSNPSWLEKAGMVLPCGHCRQCRMARAREWATRILHESYSYNQSVFATLTYDDVNLPLENSINKRELQLFFKKLRKPLPPRTLKYYACGEYGDEKGRPHYHAIILGLGNTEICQHYIEDSWQKGQVYLGSVTYQSCRYVAGYIWSTYDGAMRDHWQGKEEPFRLCSQGIGLRFAQKNERQIKSRLEITINGVQTGLPRYYRKKLEITADMLQQKQVEKRKELEAIHEKRVGANDGIYQSIVNSRRQAILNEQAKYSINSKKRDIDTKHLL